MPNWIELEGLNNLRDVGGTPLVSGGEVRSGQLLRSDNLQDLTADDIAQLRELGLRDVIDLRSAFERHHVGISPLVDEDGMTVHPLSYLNEVGLEGVTNLDEAAELIGNALPFQPRGSVPVTDPVVSTYLGFLADRPAEVLTALRIIAHGEGATLVHCAAGKDRTGVTIALALLLVGADPDAVVADYALSSERVPAVVERMMRNPIYGKGLAGRPMDSHLTRPETMQAFIDYIEAEYGPVSEGGLAQMMAGMGWTEEDQAALEARLVG